MKDMIATANGYRLLMEGDEARGSYSLGILKHSMSKSKVFRASEKTAHQAKYTKTARAEAKAIWNKQQGVRISSLPQLALMISEVQGARATKFFSSSAQMNYYISEFEISVFASFIEGSKILM